ncbi:MAG: hypothetical protein JWM02_183, partial [Frankiales bacterium]|nr:hypothetical protein [Frankiales bacterium]
MHPLRQEHAMTDMTALAEQYLASWNDID